MQDLFAGGWDLQHGQGGEGVHHGDSELYSPLAETMWSTLLADPKVVQENVNLKNEL